MRRHYWHMMRESVALRSWVIVATHLPRDAHHTLLTLIQRYQQFAVEGLSEDFL